MEIIDDRQCFVCGENNPHGLKAHFCIDSAARAATCELSVEDCFAGWKGIVHGGILATLMDECAAWAARSLTPHVVTAEMTVRYKEPVATGAAIRVHARIVGQRRRILEIAAQIAHDGRVCAEADIRMFMVQPPQEA